MYLFSWFGRRVKNAKAVRGVSEKAGLRRGRSAIRYIATRALEILGMGVAGCLGVRKLMSRFYPKESHDRLARHLVQLKQLSSPNVNTPNRSLNS